jgi:hypothetical protein
MAVGGDWMSLGEMMQGRQPSETHIACFCRPDMTHCGQWTPGNRVIDVTTLEAERQAQRVWCAGCLNVFEGNGCGICGCRLGLLCDTCEAAFQQ